MKIICLCHTCAKMHAMDFDPLVGPGAGFSDWLTKHPEGHFTEFEFPRRSGKDHAVDHPWMDYMHNADVKTAYAATQQVTITLTSLAASSTLLAGRESNSVDNSVNKYLEYMAAGFFKTAASNAQIGSINVAVVGALQDGSLVGTGALTWPDVFDGTDSVETVSLQNVYDQVCKIATQITTTATNALVWPFGPTGLSGLFGGVMPNKFVFFVSQSAETSTNSWSATATDHQIYVTPAYATVSG